MLSHVQLFATPRTVAHQAPLSMGIFRQEYWSGLPFSAPGDLPDPGIEPSIPQCRQVLYHLSHQGGPLGISRAASREEQESEDHEEESVVTMFF